MKLTTGILAITITVTAAGTLASTAAAQNTDAIDNARSIAKSLQQKQANDSNAALDAAGTPAAKPAPGAPAPAVKPAVIPGSKPAATAPAPAPAPAPKAAAASSLQRVNVVQGSETVRVEIIASHAVSAKVSKLDSPARVLVELPETSDASPQNHIAFNSAGVKGIRIGSNGKNPPTTSVVVDLDKSCAYELTPGTGEKLVLTLHPDVLAKTGAGKPAAPAATVQTVAKSNPAPTPKPAVATTSNSAPVAAKPATKTETASAKGAKPTTAAAKPAKDQNKTAAAAVPAEKPAAAEPAKTAEAAKPKEDKKWAMSGKRDPFFSPVVQQNGSGCSTGKKCLEIGAINLRGVVKSDSGFIAVVTNNLNKAYFLRENDPVFNGYVVRITGDSVVFQETVQDKLGKPFTREVVKRIFTPAV
jgi:Tfp pilus assembly protein PilP